RRRAGAGPQQAAGGGIQRHGPGGSGRVRRGSQVSKTRAELVTRALEKIRVVGSGQTASAEDAQLVDKIVDPLMEDLAARGIFQWGDEDDLPEAAFEHLAWLLGNLAAPDFGKPEDDAKRRMMEARLRLLDSATLSGEPVRAEYF